MMDYLFIALTAAVIGFCFRGPQWGMAALAFTLPLSGRLPSLPIPLLNSQNLVVLAGLMALMMRSRSEGRAGTIRFLAPLILFLLLLTLAFANTMLVFEPIRYAFAYKPYDVILGYKAVLTCVLLYVMGCLVARTREDIVFALKGLMLGAAFEGAFVCLEVVMRGPARANGHLSEGNSAGAYLAGSFAAGLALFLLQGFRSRWGQFSLATSAASGIGLLFTMSRGNWVAGILGGGGVALLRDRRALVLLVLGLMAYPLWLPQKAMDRIDESFIDEKQQGWRFTTKQDTDEAASITGLQNRLMGEEGAENRMRLDSSSQVRLYVWQAGMKMIQDYPLGVGYGVFPFYLHLYSDVIRFRAAHNSYLLLAAELGIPALIVFLVFLGLILFESLRAYTQVADPLMRGLALAAFGSTIAMMVSAVFYNFFFHVEVNGQQWLLAGLATQIRLLPAIAPEAVTAPATASGEPVPLYRMVT